LRRGDVSDRQAEHKLPVQSGSGKESPAAGVDALEQIAIICIRSAVAEAHQRKQNRGGQLKTGVGGDVPRQILRQFHVAAQDAGNSFASEVSQDEP